jgi:hypothetical protein
VRPASRLALGITDSAVGLSSGPLPVADRADSLSATVPEVSSSARVLVAAATAPRVLASLQLTFGAALGRGDPGQLVFGLIVAPGCWCATVSPASGSSTRWSTCRSRCRRPSPASR